MEADATTRYAKPLRQGDPFAGLADFESCSACQYQVEAAYPDPNLRARRSIPNTARMGRFSSDCTIRAHAQEIWNVPATRVSS
jgi:starch phosphorylase